MTPSATRCDRLSRPALRAAGLTRVLAPALAALVVMSAGAAEDASHAEVRAQALTVEASAAVRDQRLEAARDGYRAALVADPGHAPARDGLRAVEALLAGTPDPATAQPAPEAVREQLALVEATAAIERAELLARAGRVGAGREALALARERLTPLTHRGTADRDLARVQTLLDDLSVRDVDGERVAAGRARAEALEAAEAAAGQADRIRRGSFDEQVDRIVATRLRGHFDLALAQCRRLVRDHPGEPRAEALYSELLALAHDQRRRQFDEQLPELRQQVMERLHEALIPSGYDGQPIYPPNWLQRHEGRTEIGQEAVAYEPWQEQILDRLAGRITVDFETLPIEEALAFVARQAGFNLVIDPTVYASGGKVVNLRAADIRLDYCLNWLARLADTTWVVTKGAVYFGGQQQEDAVLAVYDLSHLVNPPYDQPGLTVGYSSGTGGQAANIFETPADTATTQLSPEDVVDTIKTVISPATWTEAGNGIEIRSNILYVTAPKRVHHLLAEFIREQANARNLAVHVAAKWLTLTDTYLEEIGVNWGAATNLLRIGTPPLLPDGFRGRNQESDTTGNVNNVLPSSSILISPATAGTGLNLSGLFIDRQQLSAVFSAVERKDDSRVLASPELTTLNGVRSSAFFGSQFAYIADYEVVNSNLDPVIEVLTIGANLDIKPYVSADRKFVTMEFRPALASVQFFTELISAPRINSSGGGVGGGVIGFFAYPIELPNILLREVSTTVVVPDRGTLMVGGFGTYIDQTASAKVPFLGHIPYLGRLFGTRGRYSQRSKLYLLATVDIINYQEAEEHL